jgi:hypothetical protein
MNDKLRAYDERVRGEVPWWGNDSANAGAHIVSHNDGLIRLIAIHTGLEPGHDVSCVVEPRLLGDSMLSSRQFQRLRGADQVNHVHLCPITIAWNWII